MWTRTSLLVVALALALTACGAPTDDAVADDTAADAPAPVRCTLPGRATEESGVRVVAHEGRDRRVRVTPPTDVDGPAPLVVALHGHGGSAAELERSTEVGTTGAARGFLVVTPEGEGEPRRWNFDSRPDGADDYGFVDTLVQGLVDGGCATADRAFVVGSSNGAAFAGLLACRPPHRFAAVAMVIATVPTGCGAEVPLSVLTIRGTADAHVRYDGTPEAVAEDAARHGCDPDPEATTAAPGVEELRWIGCRGGREVVLMTVVDGTHAWPGGTGAPTPADHTLSATDAVLDLFARTAPS